MTRHRRTVTRALALILALTGAAALAAAPAGAALTPGYKAVASEDASGVHGSHTGFGPGWVALTFDTGGTPHGPVIGYLFHDGVAGAVGNDHMQVTRYLTGGAASVPTPFAAGYAYGNFGGCAWSYLDSGGDELYPAAGDKQDCTPPSHTTAIFCTDHAHDPLCSDGSGTGEGEPGVWRNTHHARARIKVGGCDVYGNVGAAAIYRGGASVPRNRIGHVDSGTVQVRFVVERGGFVMANLGTDGSPQLPTHLEWGFYPRGCLTALS